MNTPASPLAASPVVVWSQASRTWIDLDHLNSLDYDLSSGNVLYWDPSPKPAKPAPSPAWQGDAMLLAGLIAVLLLTLLAGLAAQAL